VLFPQLGEVEVLGGLFNLLVQLLIEVLVLEGPLIQLLLETLLLEALVGHVVQLGDLLVVDATLGTPEDSHDRSGLLFAVLQLLNDLGLQRSVPDLEGGLDQPVE
jgi:hypothetical protein